MDEKWLQLKVSIALVSGQIMVRRAQSPLQQYLSTSSDNVSFLAWVLNAKN